MENWTYTIEDEHIEAVYYELQKKLVLCPSCRSYRKSLEPVTSLGEDEDLRFYPWAALCRSCVDTRKSRIKRKAEVEKLENEGHLLPGQQTWPKGHDKIGGYTYLFFYKEGVIKIGCSKNPIKRLSDLKYNTTQFLLAIKNDFAYSLEQALHAKYRTKQVKNLGGKEFFNLSLDDIDWIRNIKTVGDRKVKIFVSINELQGQL